MILLYIGEQGVNILFGWVNLVWIIKNLQASRLIMDESLRAFMARYKCEFSEVVPEEHSLQKLLCVSLDIFKRRCTS